MKTIIVNLIVVTALSFSVTALAAEQMEGKAQPHAAQPAAPASAVPPVTAAKSAPPAAAQEPQPASKPSTPGKPATAKPPRSKSLDLRHCLDMETDAAIAKCAGE